MNPIFTLVSLLSIVLAGEIHMNKLTIEQDHLTPVTQFVFSDFEEKNEDFAENEIPNLINATI